MLNYQTTTGIKCINVGSEETQHTQKFYQNKFYLYTLELAANPQHEACLPNSVKLLNGLPFTFSWN